VLIGCRPKPDSCFTLFGQGVSRGCGSNTQPFDLEAHAVPPSYRRSNKARITSGNCSFPWFTVSLTATKCSTETCIYEQHICRRFPTTSLPDQVVVVGNQIRYTHKQLALQILIPPHHHLAERHDALYVVGSLEETLELRGMRYHPIDIENSVVRCSNKIIEWWEAVVLLPGHVTGNKSSREVYSVFVMPRNLLVFSSGFKWRNFFILVFPKKQLTTEISVESTLTVLFDCFFSTYSDVFLPNTTKTRTQRTAFAHSIVLHRWSLSFLFLFELVCCIFPQRGFPFNQSTRRRCWAERPGKLRPGPGATGEWSCTTAGGGSILCLVGNQTLPISLNGRWFFESDVGFAKPQF